LASEKNLNLKKSVVSEILDKVKNSSAILFFDNKGLSDTELKELRTKLRESDSELKVYKNTLTRLALKELDYNLNEDLIGPKTIVFSNDVIESIKALTTFAKTHENLEIRLGIIDNEISDMAKINALSTIPSRDGLLTMLAGGLIGIPKDLSICLNLLSEQMEK